MCSGDAGKGSRLVSARSGDRPPRRAEPRPTAAPCFDGCCSPGPIRSACDPVVLRPFSGTSTVYFDSSRFRTEVWDGTTDLNLTRIRDGSAKRSASTQGVPDFVGISDRLSRNLSMLNITSDSRCSELIDSIALCY